jgi:predicted porin
MKKHLIAATVAAAVAVPAMAQDVQVYGIVGTAYTNFATDTLFDNTLKTKNTGSTRGEQAGNRLGFRGTEDLGRGLKAGFVYELGIDMDSGATSTTSAANTRLAYAQIQGDFGTVRAGKVDSLTRQVFNGFTAHGNTNFAPGNLGGSGGVVAVSVGQWLADNDRGCTSVNATTSALPFNRGVCDVISNAVMYGGTRVNNSIGYISPSVSGFTFQVQYGRQSEDRDTGDTARGSAANNTSNSSNSVNFGVTYAAGPLAISFAQDKAKLDLAFDAAGATTAPLKVKNTTNMIGVSYDLGMAKLFGNYTTKKNDIGTVDAFGDFDVFDSKIKDLTVGVQVPTGAWLFVASVSDGSHKYDNEFFATPSFKDDTSAYQLQANYNMSKRTKLYAMYGQSKYKLDSDWNLDDVKQKGYSFGIQHSF